MADKLPVKCTLKQLQKTYYSMFESFIVNSILLGKEMLVYGIAYILPIAVISYFTVLQYIWSLLPSMWYIGKTCGDIIAFPVCVMFIIMCLWLLYVCSVISGLIITRVYAAIGIIQYLNIVDDEKSITNTWLIECIFTALSIPVYACIFSTMVCLYMMSRYGIHGVLAMSIFFKTMQYTTVTYQSTDVMSLLIFIFMTFAIIGICVIIEPAVKCLAVNLNANNSDDYMESIGLSNDSH